MGNFNLFFAAPSAPLRIQRYLPVVMVQNQRLPPSAAKFVPHAWFSEQGFVPEAPSPFWPRVPPCAPLEHKGSKISARGGAGADIGGRGRRGPPPITEIGHFAPLPNRG